MHSVRVLAVLFFLATASTALSATKAIKFANWSMGGDGSSPTPSSLSKASACKA